MAAAQSTDQILKLLDWWQTQCRAWSDLQNQSLVLISSIANIRSQRIHTTECQQRFGAHRRPPPQLSTAAFTPLSLLPPLPTPTALLKLQHRQTSEIEQALARIRTYLRQMEPIPRHMASKVAHLRRLADHPGPPRKIVQSQGGGEKQKMPITQHTIGPALLQPERALDLMTRIADMYHNEFQARQRLWIHLVPLAMGDGGPSEGDESTSNHVGASGGVGSSSLPSSSAVGQSFDSLRERWREQYCIDPHLEAELDEIVSTLQHLKQVVAS
ncbi:hypothetical protein BJ085DRAFT_40318 [Dimargaris cristalligena]|uniref:Uncharacterized protein n=1 Tax=Dimargaris cristalligena TaxID=215637 RepID=A0A4P9ZVT9_9FUNG|nr:hypothetical protein BJ085DRAFT_40318 [Dimargaris cristalligena]|eukprot:RKP37061.1 hypothetical protein BJ085DRAFT_40318 [Dimargaris cristalligena]